MTTAHETCPLTPKQLPEFLLHVATVRPVMILGAPGIGKTALVQQFAELVGLPCVSLLGSQLAPEDLLGVPQLLPDGRSRFCPPTLIAQPAPYLLFLDELNASSPEVQKAFYSLIHDRRIGEYRLPAGSIVIGAGNRAQDNAITKPMSSALVNRMLHVHLKVSARDWLEWAHRAGLHPLVLEYIQNRPDHLWSQPPKHEEPFSTPRSWHMLSDALHSYGVAISDPLLEALAYGALTPHHAGQFKVFARVVRNRFAVDRILKGDDAWPAAPADRDILYFLAHSFRARLIKELPATRDGLVAGQHQTVHLALARLKELAHINLEMAQMVVGETEDGTSLPDWLRVEVVRVLPQLAAREHKASAA
jgi:MoxR-like ATPase